MTVLVIDAGTSSVRSLALDADGSIRSEHHVAVPPLTPEPGLVEVDPRATAAAALETATAVLAEVGAVDAVGIANQRASTLAWDARTGEPIAPGIGWQDLRTVGRCLELRAEGLQTAPNQSATKAEWLLQRAQDDGLDLAHLRLGTIDTWLAWTLTGGAHFVTDASNAQVTGLADASVTGWDPALLERFGIPPTALPSIEATSGALGTASALPGEPVLAALVGDQQASLVGQGCLQPGAAKVTVGTGAMLDVCLGADPGPAPTQGTFPILGWRDRDGDIWAREAVLLAAGACIDWVCDGLGLAPDPAATGPLAASVDDTDGVVFVPSLSGAGTPRWDHGARGLLVGLTRATTRAHVVRAVLEGIALGIAELVDAAETDGDTAISTLGLDGGMSANETFVHAVADATGRPVAVSHIREATALGAGFLAGTATGVWPDLDAAVARRQPAQLVEPARSLDRERFQAASERAAGWIPALSNLDL